MRERLKASCQPWIVLLSPNVTGVVSEVRERLEFSGCLESIGCLVLL